MKYCKPKLSFFIFTSYERSECFIFGVKRKMLHNEVASSVFALASYAVTSLKRLHFYEARLSAYEAFCGVAAKYEAPQMRYEAKPFQASYFFALKSRQKNGGEGGIRTRGKISPTTV